MLLMIKIFPSKNHDYIGLLALPFKTFLLAVGCMYPIWRLHTPGFPGLLGSGYLTEHMQMLAIGCYISCAGLAVTAILYRFRRHRRLAAWNCVYALVALIMGGWLTPPLFLR
jgi:hypothetical protein